MSITDAATGLIDTALNYPRHLFTSLHAATNGDPLAPLRAAAVLPYTVAETITTITAE